MHISKDISHISKFIAFSKYEFELSKKTAMLLIDKKLLLEHSATDSFTLPIGSIAIFMLHSNAIKDSDSKC